jgi:hypothetical protein
MDRCEEFGRRIVSMVLAGAQGDRRQLAFDVGEVIRAEYGRWQNDDDEVPATIPMRRRTPECA